MALEGSGMLLSKQVQKCIKCIQHDRRAWLDITGGETKTSETHNALQDQERTGNKKCSHYLTPVHRPTWHNHNQAYIIPHFIANYYRFSFFQEQ